LSRSKYLWFAAVALLILTLFLGWNNVPDHPAAADSPAVVKLMQATGGKVTPDGNDEDFSSQIDTILAVQRAVLAAAPVDEGIPLGRPRELPDLLQAGKGLCYDRSRAIETVLNALGFETRHLYVISTAETQSLAASMATRGTPSHAVTEVRTKKGWMLIDSNSQWIGLTADGEVVTAVELRQAPDQVWDARSKDKPMAIFSRPYRVIYGLYSRHGKFYPPYLPVPDLNWRQLLHNID